MLGTLSGSTYTFQHLVGILRLQYPSLPAGTKSVKFEANVRITGAYTTTVADHELKQDTKTTDNAVTINLSEATTAAVENARFIIPLPTGSYAGFKVSAINADGTVLSSYTTYKTYELKLGDIALYDLKTQGTNSVSLLGSGGTYAQDGSTRTATFNDGWVITNVKSKTYSAANTSWVKYGNSQHTITIPAGKAVTKITFDGYTNDSSATDYISEIGGTTLASTDMVFPTKTSTAAYTIVLAEQATGSLTFTIGGEKQACLKLYITYTDVTE
jgi:hypothetical protein